MTLNPKALDEEGYIIAQKRLTDVPFGTLTSDKNGCGWIAVYNFLKAMDREKDPETLVKTLEKTLFPSSRFGMNFIALAGYLRLQGIPLNLSLRPFHSQQLSESCRAGVILYRAGKTNHFVAFRREAGDKLRFYGARSGTIHHDMTMGEFYFDYVKFPLTLTITAK